MIKDIFSLIKGFFSTLTMRFVFIIFFAAGFALYIGYLNGRRKANPMYVKAVITDRYDRTQKGYFKYRFEVNGKTYINSAYRSLCSECKDISCVIGDSVLIEYRKDNPKNSTPVCNR